MAPAFTSQESKGDTAEGEWAEKVEQYVLGSDVGAAYTVIVLGSSV
jgi:hypothetical protein